VRAAGTEPVPEEDGEEPEDQERGVPDDYPSEGKFHRTTLDHFCNPM
jgi:hypothetical protein